MRATWSALALMLLAGPAVADECRIVWWDLFLPQSEVELEMTSEVSAILTLKNTGQSKPINFELALSDLTDKDGKSLQLLLAEQTLVSGGISNQVTVTLQPQSKSWLVGFESNQTIRAQDGQTYNNPAMHTGWLSCNELMPLP